MKIKVKVLFILSFCYLPALIAEVEESEVFNLDWSELQTYNNEPEWFQDAKFGIYFHWGVYSVPAFGSEWYPRWMHFEGQEIYEHHLKTYGHPSEFGYHDFVPMFKAEHFDANEWARLFKKAGAKFAGPVAEHHDGFSMWASDVTPWNVGDKGPKKDITGELEKAIRSEGMKLITSFHHARNLQRPDHPQWKEHQYPDWRFNWNQHYPAVEGMPPSSDDEELKYLYGRLPEEKWLKEVWFAKLKEVIDHYHPDIIWFDSWLNEIPESYRYEFLKYYYSEAEKKDQEVVVTFKQDDFPEGTAVFNIEKGGKTEISENVWQSDDTISMGSWCYTEGLKIKPVSMVVHSLIDIVSKNGVLLLNISPMADGTIPENQKEVLTKMGEWLALNGEGIYSSRPWLTYGEGPTGFEEGHFGGMATTNVYNSEDKRYTKSKDGKYVYAFVLSQPESDEVIQLQAFGEGEVAETVEVQSISLIGDKTEVDWSRNDNGIEIVPSNSFQTEIALVYKIHVK